MKPVILHIPHSSTFFPNLDGYCVDENVLKNEILKLTDWYTDDLFFSVDVKIIKTDFSRIFCDVERFEDDSNEVMAKYGMGAIYEKCDDGFQLRIVTDELRKKIMEKFYNPHHQKLSLAVAENLEQFGKSLIIDCHSFSDIPFYRDLNKEPNRPDICIGTDDFHTSQALIDFTIEYFEKMNLKVAINTPYSGTIVPLKFYKIEKRVQSIMIEINRKLYLNNSTN